MPQYSCLTLSDGPKSKLLNLYHDIDVFKLRESHETDNFKKTTYMVTYFGISLIFLLYILDKSMWLIDM